VKLNTHVLRSFPIALASMVLLVLVLAPVASARPAAGLSASAEHIVTHISLGPRTPNILRLNQRVTISFHYATNENDGVRIFARPMTGAALTPHYAAHPSPLYPTGTGTGSGYFTVTSGNATVTGIRFQMWNHDQTQKLFESVIPAHYQFRSAAQLVSGLVLTATPNVLKPGQRVSVKFKYKAMAAGGVRIFARPLSGGGLTPNYGAHPSPLYPVGSGTGSGWFTVTSGSATVTHVRLQIWNAVQTRLLFQASVPVSYQFRPPANIVTSIGLTPASPNILKFDDMVNIALKYTTNDPGGVRIFTRPFSGGVLTPHYGANPSPLYPVGSGTATGFFTISDVPATVDHIRIQMWNDGQTVLLFERMIPVSYQFK